jgi:hypothetical protein
VRLEADDALIAIGPDEGHSRLADLCGFVLIDDDATGEIELVPVSQASTGEE